MPLMPVAQRNKWLIHCVVGSAATVMMSIASGSPASAGIWQWDCMGRSGHDQIAFNRGALIVAEGTHRSASSTP